MTDTQKSEHKLLVFLSHAKEDKRKVRKLCESLQEDGFDPWLDEERILPGQDWDLEIEKALRASDAILLCFSELSVQKEGYVQREFIRAQRYAEEKPKGTIFVIPIRLDECEIPFEYQKWQYVNYPEKYDQLVKALNMRAGKEHGKTTGSFSSKKPQKRVVTKSQTPPGSGEDGGPTYHFNGSVSIENFNGRDQYNTYYGGQTTNIHSQTDFTAALQELKAQIVDLQKQPDLTGAQQQEVQTVAEQVTEAVEEASQLQPDGQRINDTLQKAQRTMDSLKGSIGSAVGLGTTLAGLIKIAMELFGG